MRINQAATVFLALTLVGCTASVSDKPGPDEPSGGKGGAGFAEPGNPTGGNPPDSEAACTGTSPPAGARLWLLSDSQYVNTVADVFGITITGEVTGPRVTGIPVTVPEGTAITAQTAFRYSDVAAQTARTAVTKMDALVTCQGGAKDEACAEQFVRTKIARAFRRPLLDAEVSDLIAVYKAGAAGEGFAGGMRVLLEATLQAPSMLYRQELKAELGAHELAGAISLMLLDSVADDALWKKAVDGTILTPAVLRGEVERLLALPRVRDNLSRSVHGWLAVRKVEGAVKDVKLFPDFTPTLQKSLVASASRLVDDVLWNGKFPELFTSGRIYADATMSKVFNLPAVLGSELMPVEAPESERGGGILTHPATMAGIARAADTDVVRRGLFVHHGILCGEDVPSPPAGIEAQVEKDAELPTERDRAQARARNGLCAGCHASFDHYGVALEHYDAIGRYRTTLLGKPIDASANIVGLGKDLDGTVTSGVDLGKRIARSPRIWSCALEHVAFRAFGRNFSTQEEACAFRPVEVSFAKSGAFIDLIRDLVLSPAFARRTPGT